jgi:hypothetical protein
VNVLNAFVYCFSAYSKRWNFHSACFGSNFVSLVRASNPAASHTSMNPSQSATPDTCNSENAPSLNFFMMKHQRLEMKQKLPQCNNKKQTITVIATLLWNQWFQKTTWKDKFNILKNQLSLLFWQVTTCICTNQCKKGLIYKSSRADAFVHSSSAQGENTNSNRDADFRSQET